MRDLWLFVFRNLHIFIIIHILFCIKCIMNISFHIMCLEEVSRSLSCSGDVVIIKGECHVSLSLVFSIIIE